MNPEAEFSKQVIRRFKASNFDVQRIESHSTGNGIPDLFIQGNGFDYWIELKAERGELPTKIFWRPGQQAWALNYYKMHNYHRNTLTLVKCDNNRIIVIPMIEFYEDNRISHPQVITFEEFKSWGLTSFFTFMTYVPFVQTVTVRELLCAYQAMAFPTIDYDPDIHVQAHAEELKDAEALRYVQNKLVEVYRDMHSINTNN